jgi:DNA modification methylase
MDLCMADTVAPGGPTTTRRTEYVRLSELKGADSNPKLHDLAGIRQSIAEHGLAELPLLDERTGRLVAGHGRLKDLRERRSLGGNPPEGVDVDDDGEWLVPVQRGWASRDDDHAKAYLAASNKLSENGGWDYDLLPDYLQDLAGKDLLHLTGFSEEELAELLAEDAQDDDDTDLRGDPDAVPDVPPDPITVLGDVYQLGRHRLICGDATDVGAVDTLMGGRRADMMWTDPPYGVAYVGKTKDALTIQNDAGPDGLPELLAGAYAAATVALKAGAPVYVAHPDSFRIIFEQAMLQAGWKVRQNLIWAKDVLVLGRSDYHYRHEPILYGFTDGGDGRLGRGGDRWYGDNAATTVFDVPKPSRSSEHPTMKPIALITAMLVSSCPPGGIVYDPFGGSGSTLLAAHAHGAAARLIELDPAYCDVICRRFQQATGVMPLRVGDPRDAGDGVEQDGERVDFLAD